MKKFLANALLSLVMDKSARDKLEERRQAGNPAERDQRIDEIKGNVEKLMTPERQELIRNALDVHRAKARILDDLGDEKKQRLYALAVKRLLHEDDGKDG